MKALWLSGLVLAAALAADVAPVPLAVFLEDPQGLLAQTEDPVVLSATRSKDGHEETSTLSLKEFQIELPTPGRWRLSCHHDDLWCPPITVDAGQVSRVSLAVFPRTSLTGTLQPPEGEPLPTHLTLQGWIHRDQKPTMEFEVPVAIEGETLSASLPGARLDLRLAVDGFSPHYFWDVDARQEPVDLGPLRLHRGGSLSGFVFEAETGRPAFHALAELSPEGTHRLASDLRQRMDRMEPGVRVNNRGFFQFRDLPAGRYRLRVSQDGLASQELGGLEIEENVETFLGDWIELDQLLDLVIALEPATDLAGRSWRLDLVSRQRPNEPAQRAFTDPQGLTFFSQLEPGPYVMHLLSESGSLALVREIDLNTSETIELALPVVPIVGRVRLDDAPLVAEVELQTGQGDAWKFKTDDEGRFNGLARTPSLGILFVDIDAVEPPFRSKLTMKGALGEEVEGVWTLDLDLGSRQIRGEVVMPAGQPVPGALVRADGEGWSVRSRTAADGSFLLPGIGEGAYELRAEHPDHGTARIPAAEVSSATALARQRLVLNGTRKVEGALESASGLPVAGAEVTFISGGRAPAFDSATTDLAGGFELRVSTAATRGVVTVAAPSQLLWSACRSIDPQQELQLQLPQAPGGEIVIETSGRSDLPPATGGRLVLLNEQGGFFTLGDLAEWNAMIGLIAAPDPGAPTSSQRFSALASGSYALTWGQGPPWSSLVDQLCSGGLPDRLDWQYLGPGGQVHLELDLSRRQEAEVR